MCKAAQASGRHRASHTLRPSSAPRLRVARKWSLSELGTCPYLYLGSRKLKFSEQKTILMPLTWAFSLLALISVSW